MESTSFAQLVAEFGVILPYFSWFGNTLVITKAAVEGMLASQSSGPKADLFPLFRDVYRFFRQLQECLAQF